MYQFKPLVFISIIFLAIACTAPKNISESSTKKVVPLQIQNLLEPMVSKSVSRSGRTLEQIESNFTSLVKKIDNLSGVDGTGDITHYIKNKKPEWFFWNNDSFILNEDSQKLILDQVGSIKRDQSNEITESINRLNRGLRSGNAKQLEALKKQIIDDCNFSIIKILGVYYSLINNQKIKNNTKLLWDIKTAVRNHISMDIIKKLDEELGYYPAWLSNLLIQLDISKNGLVTYIP